MFAIILALAPSLLPAQALSDSARTRIVVFQFAAVPSDSANRAGAARFSRALVDALMRDSSIRVMSHPRASMDPSRPPGNAQYGIVGGLVYKEGRIQVEIRTTDLAAVTVLARDTGSIADSTMTATIAAAGGAARLLSQRLASLRRPPPQPCNVTDLMPTFWPFWDEARDLSPTERYQRFTDAVWKPNAGVYDAIFRGAPVDLAQWIPQSIERAQSFEPMMRSLASTLATELPTRINAFRGAFPDFTCDVPVYFLYSAGAMDGGTRTLGGRTVLVFGIDEIARIHGTSLGPLVMHELFHVYHGQVAPAVDSALYWQVWQEGLATWVSRQLNPGVPEEQACCLPAAAPIEAARPKIVAELLQRFESTDDEHHARYLFGGQTLDIPERSGYYIGYLVAKKLGEKRTLQQLASMGPDSVRVLMRGALRGLGTRG